MGYTVIERRTVPAVTVARTLIAKRTVATPNLHAGEQSAYVEIESGMRAWGFGADDAAAEADAVRAAASI